MSKEESSSGSILVAFVLGAVAGAAIALLYAPAAGNETRRKIAEKAREGRQRAEDAVRQGAEFVRRQRESLSQAIDAGVEAFAREASGGERKETM